MRSPPLRVRFAGPCTSMSVAAGSDTVVVSSDEDDDVVVLEGSPAETVYMVPLSCLHPLLQLWQLGVPLVICQLLHFVIPQLEACG